jgi:hypothetical protein
MRSSPIAARLAVGSVSALVVAGVACSAPGAAAPARPGSTSGLPSDASAALQPSDDDQAAALVDVSIDAGAEAERQRRERDRQAAAAWRPGPDDGSDTCLHAFTDDCCGDVAFHGHRVRGALVCPKGQVPQWMCRGTRTCHPR